MFIKSEQPEFAGTSALEFTTKLPTHSTNQLNFSATPTIDPILPTSSCTIIAEFACFTSFIYTTPNPFQRGSHPFLHFSQSSHKLHEGIATSYQCYHSESYFPAISFPETTCRSACTHKAIEATQEAYVTQKVQRTRVLYYRLRQVDAFSE
jgi:hypothetical protein